MKYALAAAAVAALFAVAPAAQAMDAYGNIGYSNVDVDPVNLGGITGRIGMRGANFGVEGEGTFGIQGDEIAGVDVDLSSELGVYAVGFLPVSENTDLIARIGYARIEVDTSFGSGDDDGFAYGVGIQHFFGGGANGVRADYTHFALDSLDDADAWTISYVRKF
jgi:hypothetical protein